jgi:hypothetical protein
MIWVGRVADNVVDTDWLTTDRRKLGTDIVKDVGGATWRMNLVEDETERSATPAEKALLCVITGATFGMEDTVHFPAELWEAIEQAHQQITPVPKTLGSDAVNVHQRGPATWCRLCPRHYLHCLLQGRGVGELFQVPAGVPLRMLTFQCR